MVRARCFGQHGELGREWFAVLRNYNQRRRRAELCMAARRSLEAMAAGRAMAP